MWILIIEADLPKSLTSSKASDGIRTRDLSITNQEGCGKSNWPTSKRISTTARSRTPSCTRMF